MRPDEPGFGPRCGPGFGPDRPMRHRHAPGFIHGHGPTHGPGPRFFERGGIKFAVLEHLKDKPRHGYDIIRAMEEQSKGFYSPSPGAIYPTLQALEDQDLVTSTIEEGKKIYTITEAGLAYLEEHKERAQCHRERWESQWGPGPQGESWAAFADIRETLRDVKGTVRRSAGDPAKLKEIGAVLQEAAAKIKEILKR
jgi:DNA-binding PadR family transcriptional regulator